MNVTRRHAASLVTEHFDTETQELLDAVDVELPDFGDTDRDIAFGTPLEMYETGPLPHERMDGLDITAARDIVTVDPTATELVRERLVDVLLPHAMRLRITRPAAATAVVPLAA